MKTEILDKQWLGMGQKQKTASGMGLFKTRKSLETGRAAEETELLKAISDAMKEWMDAADSFEHAYEENLVDYYTYKMKACESRYAYFIKIARNTGLKSPMLQLKAFVSGHITDHIK